MFQVNQTAKGLEITSFPFTLTGLDFFYEPNNTLIALNRSDIFLNTTIQYTVFDDFSSQAESSPGVFTVQIRNNLQPGQYNPSTQLITIPTITMNEDVTTNITLLGFDGKGQTSFKYFITNIPLHGKLFISGIEVSINGSDTLGPVTYQPDQDYYGTDNFTYYIADNNGDMSVDGLQSLSMMPINDAPYFSPLTPSLIGMINSIDEELPHFDINLQDVDSDITEFVVEITCSYGAAVSMNQTILNSFPSGTVFFTKGVGLDDPRVKFITVKSIAKAILKDMTFVCGTLGIKIVTVTVLDEYPSTSNTLNGFTQFEASCNENVRADAASQSVRLGYVIIIFIVLLALIPVCCYYYWYKRYKKYLLSKGIILSWCWCYTVYYWCKHRPTTPAANETTTVTKSLLQSTTNTRHKRSVLYSDNDIRII